MKGPCASGLRTARASVDAGLRLRKKLLPWHESQTACAKNCYPGTSRKPLAQKIAFYRGGATVCWSRGCNRLLAEGVQLSTRLIH